MKISNWFKPKWKNTNPAVRLNEIKALDDSNTTIFSTVVLEDEDLEVRRTALERLHDIDLLISLNDQVKEPTLSLIISKKLELLALRQLRRSKDNIENLWAFIKKSKTYEELARNSKSADIRIIAIDKIKNEAILADLISRETDLNVANSVIENFKKENSWKRIKKYSKLKEIRENVSQKLDALEKKRAEKKQLELGEAKRNTLLAGIATLSDKNILDIADQIDSSEKAANKLALDFPQVDLSELKTLINKYKSDFELAQKEQEASIAKNEAYQNLKTKIGTFIHEIQTELNLKEISDDLIKSWTQAFENLYNTDFKEKFENQKKAFAELLVKAERKIKYQEDHEQEIEQVREHQKDLSEQITNLLEKEDSKELFRQVDSVKKTWDKILSKSGEPTEEVISIFNSNFEVLNTRKETYYKIEKDEFDSKASGLNNIIESIKNLDANTTIEMIEDGLRQAHVQWKEIVGENKERFSNLWRDFKDACSRFDEALQWKEWYAQKEKERLVEEIEALDKSDLGGQELFEGLKTLQESWKKAGNIPSEAHHQLWGAFKVANDSIMERCQSYFEEKVAERESNLEAKKTLCAELAEATKDVENWNEASDQVKALQERWKNIGPVVKEQNNIIWEEYRALCDGFFEKRRSFYKVEEGHREENLSQKVSLCEEVEQIVDSEDWNKVSKQIRALQAKWKKIGPVPKIDSDKIWKRFRTACDGFFDKRREHFDALDKVKSENLAAKEEICTKLESISFENLTEESKAEVENLKEEWTKIGHVKKEDSDAIWERFCQSIDAYTEGLALIDPEVKAQIEKGVQAKEAIIAETKILVESNDWTEVSNKLQSLQKDWKDVGRVGKRDTELWAAFRVLCDEFFERRRDQYEILEQARINNLAEKQDLIRQAEALATNESTDESRREIKMLRQRWKEIGHVPKANANAIHERFNTACNSLFKSNESDSE